MSAFFAGLCILSPHGVRAQVEAVNPPPQPPPPRPSGPLPSAAQTVVTQPNQPAVIKDNWVPFSASLAYPVSLFNHPRKIVGGFSLNVFYSYEYAVYGLELGVGFNQTDDRAYGLRIAGVGNWTSQHHSAGIQIAGALNYSGENCGGIYVSGGVTICGGNATGIMISGVVNLTGMSDKPKLRFVGIQIAGLANNAPPPEKDKPRPLDVTGVQLAGGTNSAGRMTGVQIGGLINGARFLSGAQIGAFASSVEHGEGLQVSVFSLNQDSFSGLQIGAIGNLQFTTFKGAQFTAGLNWNHPFSKEGDKWFFAAPFDEFTGAPTANVTLSTTGFMFAGIGNSSVETSGIQLAGLMNRTHNHMTGLQIAGLLNVTTFASGVQIGLINMSKDHHGVQLGLINLARRVEGVQIGLINVARNNPLPFLPIINMGFGSIDS